MLFARKRGRSLASAVLIGIAAAIAGHTLESRAAPSDAPVTLVIANAQWLDALRGQNLWNALLKYEKVAPNVTLKQETIPAAAFNDRMTTEMGAGQGPDIVMMQDSLFYPIADAGLLVPLDKAVVGAKLNVTNDGGVVGGKRLGIAWQRAVYALIYNKQLLDAAGAKVPTDVDGLIASSKAVMAATGAIGFAARHQIADFSGWFADFQNWAYGYGAQWVDANGKLTIDTPQAVAAVTAFKKVYDAKIIAIGDDMPTQRSRFKENKVAFSIDNSGSALNIVSGGALTSANLYAAPLPFKNPGAHQQIFVGVSANSKNQQAAIDFLAWLVSTDGQQALRDASGPDALATDVPVTKAFAAANPWAPTFLQLAIHSRSTLIPGYEVQTPQIMRFVMEAVESVIVGNVDPQSALAKAQQQVDAQKF